MPFNTWTFPLFFAAVWGVYCTLGRRGQNVLLLGASYVFYAWWDWRFLSLLALSTVVDHLAAGDMVRRPERKRMALALSLSVNLGVLGFFKYFNFFVDSAETLFTQLGFAPDMPTMSVLLPVGISFYTFQTLSYTIDVYRGQAKPCPDLLSFALYVAYFPQLVAGPIERSTHLLPQLRAERTISADQVRTGLQLILMGVFKKVFIADGVAPMVNSAFESPDSYGRVSLVCAVYLFAIQIYGDFAGYTDIARGISRLLGIELRLNFRQPYLASNITDFWRRWHISLSDWLKSYLYIPLGGNRKGNARTYANNMITMLLGGLWHGAGWNFILWGGLHGGYLALHKLSLRGGRVGELRPGQGSLADDAVWLAKTLVTFHLVCLAWIPFRAESLAHTLDYLGAMVANLGALDGVMLMAVFFYGGWVLLLDMLCWIRRSELPFSSVGRPVLNGVAYGVMFGLLLLMGESVSEPFIYFQF